MNSMITFSSSDRPDIGKWNTNHVDHQQTTRSMVLNHTFKCNYIHYIGIEMTKANRRCAIATKP